MMSLEDVFELGRGVGPVSFICLFRSLIKVYFIKDALRSFHDPVSMLSRGLRNMFSFRHWNLLYLDMSTLSFQSILLDTKA